MDNRIKLEVPVPYRDTTSESLGAATEPATLTNRKTMTQVKFLKQNNNLTKFSTTKLFRTSLLYQTKNFFNNSTLHGVRYIAEEGRPFGERFMWFCFVSTGAVAAFVIIVSLWEKFQTNPTITGLDTDYHNQQVIFPTVMVCPNEPYDEKEVKDLAYQYLGQYDQDSEKFEPFLQALSRFSYGTMDEMGMAIQNITNERVLKKKNLRDLAFRVNIKCNDTFTLCKYKDEIIQCCDFFLLVYTEHGFCYSFNARMKNRVNLEEINNNVQDLFETDKKWALSFSLTTESRVFVHSFNEHSGLDFRPQLVWNANYYVDLLISLKQTYTTEDARQLSIGQRKCIFPDEVKLTYYDDGYSFSGCMKECRIEMSLKFCKCVPPFYHPTTPLTYCTFEDLECLRKYVTNITDIRSCTQCELGCHNSVYDIEKYSKSTKTETEAADETFINIEYLTWPIIRYKREVLFGWVDLLVSFGGIAGLFLGFSLLSGVEIIYFFTMRACCMLYKDREELYEIEERKLQQPPIKYNLDLKPNFKDKHKARKGSATVQPNMVNSKTDVVVQLGEFKNDYIMKSMSTRNILQQTTFISRLPQDRLIKQNLFRTIQVAPYSQNIKPLEMKFRANGEGPLFDGYLP